MKRINILTDEQKTEEREEPIMEERSSIPPKSQGINKYMLLLGDRFDFLKCYSTAGDIRPPYPFQWVAKSIVFGDDRCDGVGSTPFEAIKDLYRQIKQFEMSDPQDLE